MIALFTDFGLNGPYVGQMHAVLASLAPAETIVDLQHDVPRHDARAGAYLLASVLGPFPPGTVFLCVVDPGVGSPRRAMVVHAGEHWFVGPDNGLFEIVARRAARCECREILWRPAQLSSTFHGRDLFAPVAASVALGTLPESGPARLTVPADRPWPDELAEVIYIDAFGNAATGLLAAGAGPGMILHAGGRPLTYADTFSAVPLGQPFWYRNSCGLVGIAVNGGSAAADLGVRAGDPVVME